MAWLLPVGNFEMITHFQYTKIMDFWQGNQVKCAWVAVTLWR